MLTRTIKVSCLSCFLHDSEPLTGTSATTRYPDSRSCTQLKFCTLTNFCLRDNLYRDTAPVPIYQLSVPGVNLGHLSNLYRDRACTQYNLYLDGKKHAIPPCTGRNIWLKYRDPARMLRRVTQPPFIAGPLGFIAGANQQTICYLYNFCMIKIVCNF